MRRTQELECASVDEFHPWPGHFNATLTWNLNIWTALAALTNNEWLAPRSPSHCSEILTFRYINRVPEFSWLFILRELCYDDFRSIHAGLHTCYITINS